MVDDPMGEITVNGERRAMSPGCTVARLIEELNLEASRIAVELNLEILPKSLWAVTLLAAGDRVEIVHFVGGG